NAVKVEGFTDNQPIRTSRFPSNWELSTARAAAVARMLMMEGIEPERLAAVGYGQYQPVARNDTEEGRRRNRRVVLLISRDASIRGAVR
ncbi:MAG: OmpA family protein, partial [Pseudomonadota bacterium]|nr:OmpA family protein [Pseudomonadota bacterium]